MNLELAVAAIDRYFELEVVESWIFVGLGALMLALAAWSWTRKHTFGRGLAIGLGAVALIQLSVGSSILLRTPAQITALKSLLRHDLAGFATGELARMRIVMNWFDVYFWIELAFIVIGAGLLIAWAATTDRAFWRGLGLGMLIQGALMLPADLLAKARGQQYIDAITPSRTVLQPIPGCCAECPFCTAHPFLTPTGS